MTLTKSIRPLLVLVRAIGHPCVYALEGLMRLIGLNPILISILKTKNTQMRLENESHYLDLNQDHTYNVCGQPSIKARLHH